MNRKDTLALRKHLAQYINDRSLRYQDMPDKTKTDQRAKARVGKELDEAVKLFDKLKVAPYKPAKAPKEITVGTCPCGKPVKMGSRYSCNTEGTTTITRVCSCGRTNDIDLQVLRRVQPVDWTVRECFCGEPVRLRSDFAGAGFPSYEGPPDYDGRTRKNRTAGTTCRGCGCKWSFQIRFRLVKDGDDAGKMERVLTNQTVTRCKRCKTLNLEGWSTVEPKKKRGA